MERGCLSAVTQRFAILSWITFLLAIAGIGCGQNGSDSVSVAEKPGVASAPATPVFTRDIAPLIYKNCATCHRPGESAPFDLLTYTDVRKHAKLIAEVTRDRYMPPWLPVHGVNRFEGARWLSDGEIATIGRWVEQGMVEGDAADLPDRPEFTNGWQLRQPDLIVTLPDPFVVDADSGDVYRNFVVPISVQQARYVQALEFRPGDTRSVHHAFMLVDSSAASRQLDEDDPGAGFGGMNTGLGAHSPGGHFISWQPGKRPSEVPKGMAWRLAPGTDLVLQLHMQATGREENVQPSVGFFFTDEAPTLFPYKLVLRSTKIDILAGSADFSFKASYQLPVPVNAMAVIPHAHYLGKKLHAYAMLPDGSKQWLLRIDDWDFNWQGDYRYQEPLRLPKGSTIVQHFTYDNSAKNPLNPNIPPERVRYGLNTTDEMGEFWIQVLPDSPADAKLLNRDYGKYALLKRVEELRGRVKRDSQDAEAWKELGKSLMAVGTTEEARASLRKAVQLDSKLADAHYLLGMTFVREQKMDTARDAFLACLARNPNHGAANNGLGIIALQSNRLPMARDFFQRAVNADPENATTVTNLARVLLQLNQRNQAIALFEKAVSLQPQNQALNAELQAARSR
jgi:tetratricopeptide (TPR) repeat protein/mono/diheme cytochrome c family protein